MDDLCIYISPELFIPTESICFEGKWALPVLKTASDIYSFADPLSWQIGITNTGDALLVCGTVQGVAQGICARCLEEYNFSLTGEIEGYFLLDANAAAPQERDNDEFDVLPSNKIIDIEPLMKAALLLELPLVPLCDEDCKGLCPVCGANLNGGLCKCCAPSDKNDGKAANPFSVLKDFPFATS